ncbi:ribosome modulation factor [Gynuella sp.]|uniref:ribosome modulation factor n=1 Tax=Gynuella sp. TaxID=2969146 RepID=UPI003D10E54C
MDNKTEWNLESLNKAYQQGYMRGLAGYSDAKDNPYIDEILAAAWDSGLDDGNEQLSKISEDHPKRA